MNTKIKINKNIFKMPQEELEEYLQFQRKGSKISNKKGKGSYNRKQKYKGDVEYDLQ